MSLRVKIILLLFLVFCLYFAANQVVQRLVVYPGFADLEEKAALQDLNRAVEGFRNEIRYLTTTCQKEVVKPAVREFIATGDPSFQQRREATEALERADHDAVYYIDPEGVVVWSRVVDPETIEPLPDGIVLPVHEVDAKHPLLDAARAGRTIEGVLPTSSGPILVAAQPIKDEAQAETLGVLMLGQFFDDDLMQALTQRIRFAPKLWPVDSKTIPGRAKLALRKLEADSTARNLVEPVTTETLHAYTLLEDLHGDAVLLVRVEVPRVATIQGLLAVRVATLSAVGAGLLILVGLWLVLHYTVIGPLRDLSDHANEITRSSDLTARLGWRRRDEIGQLAREFDAMVQHLDESRSHMLDAAHQAGMAQIATEVLHNVGNTLNSVNVASEVISERLDNSKLDGLRRAADLLGQHKDDLPSFFANDPRAIRIYEYIARLTDVMSSEHTQMRHELVGLQDKIRHIKEIIRVQQAYASGIQFTQVEDLTAIVEDALSVHSVPLGRNGVSVVRQYKDRPWVPVNKVKLMQVLVNLIRNADDAMAEQSEGPKRLILRVDKPDKTEVRIEIVDSGIGIAPEKMDEIFQYGFTSKASGHGFGLHFCANAMHEMGGSIRVSSEGKGKGACFTIHLPMDGDGQSQARD